MNCLPLDHRPFPLDEMESLKDCLLQHKIDRIRYIENNRTPHAKPRRITPNPLCDILASYKPYDGSWVEDIILGVARLDHHSTSNGNPTLSASRILTILQCMPEVSTPDIERMFEIETRQAQKYLKAAKLALFHLQRHISATRSKSHELVIEDCLLPETIFTPEV